MPTNVANPARHVATGHAANGNTVTADTPSLVARVYAESDAPARARLIESMMRPLGALALVAVAGGAFAALRQRNGWHSLQVTLDDTVRVNAGQVQDLATYLMQAAPEALGQLAEVLNDNPMALPSLSAVLLLQALRSLPGNHTARWWPFRSRVPSPSTNVHSAH